MKKALLFFGVAAVAAAAGGLSAYYVAQNNTTVEYVTREVEREPRAGSQFTAYSADGYPDLTYAAENAVEAVVNIEAIQEVEVQGRGSYGGYDPFLELFGFPQQQQRGAQPRTQERRAGGSGVIFTQDGYIVTNNHVIENATKLRVTLNDGRAFDAEIVGADPTTDIALIKIDGEKLPTIPFGNSDNLRLGEWVLAIGSPFDLRSTITAGIVSAKSRQLDVIPDEFRIESFIQTDAAVNPGNSGGALVNTKGQLVGINTVIKSQTGSYIGYSFAVPVSIVQKVVTDLKEYGLVQRAMLGVGFMPITQAFIDSRGEELGITELGGVYVDTVSPDGAASEAGIRKGDIILEVEGLKLDDKVSLQEQIGKHRPNDTIKLKIKRGKDVKHFDVTLRNKANKAELLEKSSVDVVKILGGKFRDASSDLCRKLEIDGGVQVVGLETNGLLARARVKREFVITHINDKRVLSLADLRKMTDNVESIDGVYTDGRGASYMFVQ